MLTRLAVRWLLPAVALAAAGCAQQHSDDVERVGQLPAAPALTTPQHEAPAVAALVERVDVLS